MKKYLHIQARLYFAVFLKCSSSKGDLKITSLYAKSIKYNFELEDLEHQKENSFWDGITDNLKETKLQR